jgi:hypothetical protein
MGGRRGRLSWVRGWLLIQHKFSVALVSLTGTFFFSRFQALDKDRHLLSIIADPQFLLAGFDNKSIRLRLKEDSRYHGKTDKQLAGIVTRAIRLLRDHGIIRKVPSRRRYQVSTAGRKLVHSITAALSMSTKELARLAA